MLTTTIEQRSQRRDPMGSYRWDIGATAEISGAIKEGARGSVLGTGYQMTRELVARSKAITNGETPMSEEEFNTSGYNEWMTYSDDLYPSVIEVRKDYRVGAMVNEELTKDNTWYGNLFWNMVGSTGADIPFVFMPSGAMIKGAQATTKGLRTGSTVAQASKLDTALAAGQVKGIRRMAAADLAKKVTAQQFIENSAIYWGNRYFDGDYQEADFLLDMSLSPVIGTGLNVSSIFKAKRIARTNRNLIVDKQALKQAVELGDVGGIARVLERNSETFRAEVEKDPDLSRAMKLPWTELNDPKNASDLARLKSFLSDNEDALWYQNLKGIIPRDMTLTPAEAVVKQVADQNAIIEATVTGDYTNLTGEQLEFIIEADRSTAETLELIGEDAPKLTKEQQYAEEIERSSKTRLKKEARAARKEIKRLSAKIAEGHVDIDPVAAQQQINDLQERSDRLDHAAKVKDRQKKAPPLMAEKDPNDEPDFITFALSDTSNRRYAVSESDYQSIEHFSPATLRFFRVLKDEEYTDKFGEKKTRAAKTPDRLYDGVSDTSTSEEMSLEKGSPSNQVRILAEKIEAAVDARKAILARELYYDRMDKSDQAFFDNLGRSGSQKANQPTPLAKLRVGDTFKIKGEEFHVLDIDPESWELTVQDGRTMVLHMDDIVYTDNNRVMAAPYEAGQNVVEYIANAVHEGKTFPAELLKEFDLDIPAGYRKLGENITPKLTKKQANKIRKKVEKQKAALLENEAEVGVTGPEMRLPLSEKPLGPLHPREDRVLAPFAEKYQKAAKLRPNIAKKLQEAPEAPELDLHQQSAKVSTELRQNQEVRAKAAAERRAEKSREVDRRQKAYAKSASEQSSRNQENSRKHLDQSAGWATAHESNVGKAHENFRKYLMSLLDETGAIEADITVEKLLTIIPDEALEYDKEVFREIFKIKTIHAKARAVGANFFRNPEKNLGHIGPDNLKEDLSRKLNQLGKEVQEGKKDSGDAAQEYAEYLAQMESGAVLRTIHNESVFQKKKAELKGLKPKEVIKYLKSSLDGLNRMGVSLRSPAVQNAINAEITISQAPMHEVLTKYKMFDAFTDPNNELMSDLMQANRTGEIPERWKGEPEAMFKEILEVYKKTTEALNGELNQYGANIRFLEGHSNVSQRWDSQTLLAAGFDKWAADMVDAMDWEATQRNLGGVMAEVRDENGFAQKWTQAEQMAYLTGIYEDLTAPRSDVDHPSMDIAKSFGKHRNIVLRPDAEVETLSKYSGHDSMGRLWLDQVRYKAEMVALTRELGNNPIPTFRRLVKDAGLSEGRNISRKKTLVGDKLHELDLKTLDWTLQYLTGKLDNPANIEISQYGKTTRQLSHILFLWQSGISAITDMPMAIHTVSQLGGAAPTSAMAGAFKRALRRRFYDDEPNMSSYLSQHGANFDAMMSAGARHMGLPDSKTTGSVISRMSEAVFALNGLNAWTGIMQEAFIDVMTREMASNIRAGQIDPSLMRSLEAAGVSQEEFLGLGDFVENVAGVDRLNINTENIDPNLRRNLMAFLAKYRDEAVMMPDASTAAMIRAGSQAGTFKGEVIRTMFQYQSFPLAMNRIAARKFLVNPEGDRPWTTDQVTFSNTIGFIAGMLAMSYVATVLKDLAKGREPMHMGNMTGESWVRLVNQSGMGGMLQSLMEIGTGNPKAVIAPLPATALKVAGSDSIGEAIYQSRNIWSVGSMPIVAPVVQKGVAAVFPEAVGYHFDNLNAFNKLNTDQDPLFYAPR